MSFSIIHKAAEVNRLKLSGQLTIQDFRALQAFAKESLEHFGQLLVLIELENFQGWSKEPGWEEIAFLLGVDRSVRIAFVGDKKWEDDMFMFLGKPMREIAMEFFSTDELSQAQEWLAETH